MSLILDIVRTKSSCLSTIPVSIAAQIAQQQSLMEEQNWKFSTGSRATMYEHEQCKGTLMVSEAMLRMKYASLKAVEDITPIQCSIF